MNDVRNNGITCTNREQRGAAGHRPTAPQGSPAIVLVKIRPYWTRAPGRYQVRAEM